MSENKLPTPRTDSWEFTANGTTHGQKVVNAWRVRELERELASPAPSPAVREALEFFTGLANKSDEYRQEEDSTCEWRIPKRHLLACREAISGSVPAAPKPKCVKCGYSQYQHKEDAVNTCRDFEPEAPAAPTYDDAVRALAPFLPDGWYTSEDGGIGYWKVKPEFRGESYWCAPNVGGITLPLNVPYHREGKRYSLRRIEAGKAVTP